MNWQQICAHPQLKDLPFKLETDRWGHMTFYNNHSVLEHSELVPSFPPRVELPFG